MFTPYSWITYDGDGTTATFSVPFPYVAREHVRVLIGWDPSTRSFTTELANEVGFTWASGTQITTTAPPATGTTISLVRETPIEQPLSDWQTGSPPTGRELDVADKQVLYAIQEYIDRTLQAREDFDAAVLTGTGVVLIDNLNSTLTTAGLTANQGRALRLLIEAVEGLANAAGTAATNAQAAAENAQNTADDALPLVGGTMTGPITLPGAPTAEAHAATKAYVDARGVEASGSGWTIFRRPDGTRLQLCFGVATPLSATGQLAFNWPRAFASPPSSVSASPSSGIFTATNLALASMSVNATATGCGFQGWIINNGPVTPWVGGAIAYLAIGTPS